VVVQDSATGVSLQLTNLHGDVVATASASPSVDKMTGTFEFDELRKSEAVGSATIWLARWGGAAHGTPGWGHPDWSAELRPSVG
jgi:hypothetical protein